MGMSSLHLFWNTSLKCTWERNVSLGEDYRVKGTVNGLCSLFTPDVLTEMHTVSSPRVCPRKPVSGKKCSQTRRAKVIKQVSDCLVTRA